MIVRQADVPRGFLVAVRFQDLSVYVLADRMNRLCEMTVVYIVGESGAVFLEEAP